MSAFLSVVAVVAFTATAGLPWWVVAVVALLMTGFADQKILSAFEFGMWKNYNGG